MTPLANLDVDWVTQSRAGRVSSAGRPTVGDVAAAERVEVAALRPIPLMLAGTVDALPTARSFLGWQAEPKYDGFRGTVQVERGRCVIESRRGTDLTRAFPDVAAAAAEQLPDGTVLDGELVVGVGGRLDFSQLQRRLASAGRAAQLAADAPATFLAFDALVLRGHDLRPRPLLERRRRLVALMSGCRPPLQVVPASTDYEEAMQWLRDYAAARVGVEGLVLKRLDGSYRGGARGWRKYRHRDSLELLVGAVVGSLSRPERLILAYPDEEGALVVAGGTSALNDAQALELAALLRPPAGAHPWPQVLPSGGTGVWGHEPIAVTLVDPVLVVEVLADTSTQGRHLRHVARYLRPRPDLTAVELDTQRWLGP